MTSRPRVVLADDYAPLVVALERLLGDLCEVVGRAATVAELLDAVNRCAPQIVVLDLGLPDGNGIEACRELKRSHPALEVVLLTAIDDPLIREAALGAGASEFVSKQQLHANLVPAIATIAAKWRA